MEIQSSSVTHITHRDSGQTCHTCPSTAGLWRHADRMRQWYCHSCKNKVLKEEGFPWLMTKFVASQNPLLETQAMLILKREHHLAHHRKSPDFDEQFRSLERIHERELEAKLGGFAMHWRFRRELSFVVMDSFATACVDAVDVLLDKNLSKRNITEFLHLLHYNANLSD